MKTPLAYSIVPMAPSKRTSDSGSMRRCKAVVVICRPEQSEGPACCSRGEVQVLRCAQDDSCCFPNFCSRPLDPDSCCYPLDPDTLARRSYRIVLRLWMVHVNRRRALLRNELKRRRQLHAQLRFGGQELEELLVIFQVRTGAQSP